jgi:hypothetical protein
VTNLRRTKRPWTRVWSADAIQMAPHRRSVHAKVGRRRGTTIVVTEGNEGVGGLHKGAMTSGNAMARGPGRAKAARAEMSFRRET